MKNFIQFFSIVIAGIVIAGCGGTDSAERTRNSALPASLVLPYSCAQLLTDTATEATTEIRFSLCDEAELYSIVTPGELVGSVNDQPVQGGEEISVPVGSEVNGPRTTLIVKTTGAAIGDDLAHHSGVHIYHVSLATADEDAVGANSPLLGTVYPKVSYDMPTPQPMIIYQRNLTILPGGLDRYVGYVDELAQKWAMVKLATCHSTLAHAQMANIKLLSHGFGLAQLNAKLVRNRSLFAAANDLRTFTFDHFSEANICEPGVNGFNLFVDGVEVGFTPVAVTEIASSTDAVALARSFALLRYWKQIGTNTCEAPSGITVDYEDADLRTWSGQALSRVENLRDDVTRTDFERVSARRLLDQMAMIDLIEELHTSAVSSCFTIAAGYAVPARQNIEAVLEQTSETLAPAVESQTNSSAVVPPLAEIVTNPSPVMTIPESELVWTGDVAEVGPTTTTTTVPETSTTVAESDNASTQTTVESNVVQTPQTTVATITDESTTDDSSGNDLVVWLLIATAVLTAGAFGARRLRR